MIIARASDDADDAKDEGGAASGPTDDEFKEAIRVIGERASAVFGSLADSINNPDVRAETKETKSAIFHALSVSFTELGGQLSDLANGDQVIEESADE
jgi:hypothetical protein